MKVNDSSYLNKTYTNQTISYFECLKKEISYFNKNLADFFKQLNDEYWLLAKSHSKSLQDEAKKSIVIADGLNKQYTELARKFSDVIEITKFQIPDEAYGRELAEKFLKFNGVSINFSYYITDDRQATQNAKRHVQQLNTLRQGLQHNIENIHIKLETKKKSLKRFSFGKSEKLKTIEQLEKELVASEKNYADINKEISIYELIDSFSDEQKKNFIHLITTFQKEFEVRNLAKKKLESAKKLESSNFYSIDILREMYQSLKAKGIIKKEKLHEIFIQMDKVEIKARRNEYSLGVYKGEIEHFSREISPLLAWFISEVYEADVNFVARNFYVGAAAQKTKCK